MSHNIKDKERPNIDYKEGHNIDYKEILHIKYEEFMKEKKGGSLRLMEVKLGVEQLLEKCDGTNRQDDNIGFYYMACKLVGMYPIALDGFVQNVEFNPSKRKYITRLYRG